MKKILIVAIATVLLFTGCLDSQTDRDRKAVNAQQEQYGMGQPVPSFDHSFERELVINLYSIRNKNIATHTVIYSKMGTILYDCPSIGYGIPYDTSLTNPWKRETGSNGSVAIGQAEPNGIFASTNTAATFVMCVGAGGVLEPLYFESEVASFPFSLEVNYETARVTKAGKTSKGAIIKMQ